MEGSENCLIRRFTFCRYTLQNDVRMMQAAARMRAMGFVAWKAEGSGRVE
jgi:hypothetical protein